MLHVITDSVSARKYFTHNFSLPATGSTWPVGWISSERGCCLCPSFRAGSVLSAGLPSRCLPQAPAHPGCVVPGCSTASVHCLDPGAAPICSSPEKGVSILPLFQHLCGGDPIILEFLECCHHGPSP